MKLYRLFAAVAWLFFSVTAVFAEIPLLESERTESMTARHTKITLRASVKKCAVFLNGEYQGNTTLTIADLPQGLYHLRMEKRGYEDADFMLEVRDGRHEHYYVELRAVAVDEAPHAERPQPPENAEKIYTQPL